MVFDGYMSAACYLPRGLDQGCPLSGIAFQFYNVDLLEIRDKKRGEDAVAFVDDALMLARGKSLEESNDRVKDMMVRAGGGMEWLSTHHCSFALDKFGIMGMTRRREPNEVRQPPTRPVVCKPIHMCSIEIPAVAMHKFLGVILDQELRWKDQVNSALAKGTKWVSQYRRLAKVSNGVSAKYMRRFYLTVAIPRMMYAADLFLVPQSGLTRGTKSFIGKLGHVQRQAVLHIMGAMCTSPTDSLDAHADLLPFQLLTEKLVHRAMARLVTLPTSHPLAKHVSGVARRYVKGHWAPLHEVMHAFCMRPDDYKTISP